MRCKMIMILCLIVALVGAGAFMLGYGSAVPLKGVGDLKVTSTSSLDKNPIVSVSGVIIDSSPGIAVTRISRRRNGRCIVIVVRKGLRPGRLSTGRFSLDIIVPTDVDTIAFEKSRDVIWHR